jgi:hypothetical protein
VAKYTVYMQTTASAAVTVEVDDDLAGEEALQQALDLAYDAVPSEVCAQCSGWGKNYSLDLADWEIERDMDGTETEPKKLEG